MTLFGLRLKNALISVLISLVLIAVGTWGALWCANPQSSPYLYLFQKYMSDGQTMVELQPPLGYSGFWLQWWSPRRLLSVSKYKEGRLEGQKAIWDVNGLPIMSKEYRGGVLEGRALLYYKSGQKKVEINVTEGKADGDFRLWSSSGALIASGIYNKGKAWTGIFIFYGSYDYPQDLHSMDKYDRAHSEHYTHRVQHEEFYFGRNLCLKTKYGIFVDGLLLFEIDIPVGSDWIDIRRNPDLEHVIGDRGWPTHKPPEEGRDSESGPLETAEPEAGTSAAADTREARADGKEQSDGAEPEPEE